MTEKDLDSFTKIKEDKKKEVFKDFWKALKETVKDVKNKVDYVFYR